MLKVYPILKRTHTRYCLKYGHPSIMNRNSQSMGISVQCWCFFVVSTNGYQAYNSLQFHINQYFSMGIVFVCGFFGPYDTPVEWPSTVERSFSISVSQEVTSRMASSLLTSQARAETRDCDEDQNSMLRAQSGFTWWNIDEERKQSNMIWLSYLHWSSIIIIPIIVIINVIIVIIIVAIIAIM